MARNPLNFKANLNDLVAADKAIEPILTAANISTVIVGTEEKAVAEAPLAAKISAIGKLIASGDKTEDSAQLITANGQLAAQNEKLSAEAVTAQATIGAQVQKISEVESKLTVANDGVSKLNKDYAAQGLLLEAATNETKRVTGLLNAANEEISKQCIAVNCLTLSCVDADGKAVDKPSDAQKLEAANKIPVAEKITALMGAIHSSAASIGLDLKKVPAVTGGAGAGADDGKKLSADAQIAKHLAKHGK